MARGRMISKSLSTSRRFSDLAERAGKLGEFAQSLYPLLVAHADDFGRLSGDPFTVKHLCHPTSKRSLNEFDEALSALEDVRLIARCTVGDDIVLQVNNFDEHQLGLHKRTSSKFPEIPGNSLLREQNRTEQKRTEPNPLAEEFLSGFEDFWRAYPKKVGKDAALKAYAKRSPDDALLGRMLDAVAQQARSEQWRKDGGQFIPNPATWINQGRWQDEAQRPGPTPIGAVRRWSWDDCPHDPNCGSAGKCIQQSEIDAEKARMRAS